ncbi:MAG: hypothetical protein M1831_004597 [Alyxoria varia]|nr:MAG: hypothetical protein M1831_004597 [Alyxoria varia]
MPSYSLLRRHDGSHEMDEGMDMSTGDMSGADSMLMSSGSIELDWFPKVYWIFVGAVIAAFTAGHLTQHLIYRQRIKTANNGSFRPAQPRNALTEALATFTALFREITNGSPPDLHIRGIRIRYPPLGPFLLGLSNAVLLIVLLFYKIDTTDHSYFQDIAYRAGFLSVGQIPLIFLLAGKNNLIGFFTGHGYERLTWLHRWVARTLLLTVTIHFGYWLGDWAPYGYFRNDKTVRTGLGAWSILIWIVISSFAPTRGWHYEFYVIQHIVSFLALIVMIFIHVPVDHHGWLWAGVAVFALDRLWRIISTVYISVAAFHPKKKRQGLFSGTWACRAELTPLPHGMTRLTIKNPPMSWTPGQHAFVSCHSVVPLQSHPFTISSIPSEGKLEFVVKAHRGGTRRLLDFAQRKPVELPLNSSPRTVPTIIQGAYGSMRPLRQFDSIVLLAGSTGASFTMPLLKDILHHWRHARGQSQTNVEWSRVPMGAVTRHIRFVWVVKSGEQLCWFMDQLHDILDEVQILHSNGINVKVDASIYVTCDEDFTADWNSSKHGSSNAAPESFSAEGFSYSSSDDEKMGRLLPQQTRPKWKESQDVGVREVDPRSESSSNPDGIRNSRMGACQPDGTCCCRTTIQNEEEDAISPEAVCMCNCQNNPEVSSSSAVTPSQAESQSTKSMKLDEVDKSSTQPKVTARRYKLHPDIMLLSGRPAPSTVIRRVLERAKGESAVVCCGPRSMNDDVRRTVVRLSDERAVHKGTGAQGVWYWGEGFGM